MTIDNMIEGLQIFRSKGISGHAFGAEHDEVYVYADPLEFTDEELERLEGLGFHANEGEEHFYLFT